ncbi:MAG: peptidoglycan bridge formation glycyltransferase FemA/FemB family protein [Candidatus Levybacteria bacterium]|nr:peptidoglycan bridge formation glycyltransferase FemA/FemB family protein [Candidatus Levybacteria bacterium]
MNDTFDQKLFNASVSHPLQSFEWGEFRKKTGINVIKKRFFQLTIHKIPHTPWNIGYLPKGNLPIKEEIDELIKIGKEQNCIFIQLEPNVQRIENLKFKIENLGLVSAAHPLFTKYTFILDITKSEEELLKAMHPKTRYNIKVAQKHGVEVTEDNSNKAFEAYIRLTQETTTRQKFYAHNELYHRQMWQTLGIKKHELRSMDKKESHDSNKLTAHLLVAKYNNKPLVTWILFVFKNTLYYPYGASSSEHRETMASNLMMWEAIRFGKKLGLKKFDMWGALGPSPDPKDPWFGFHRFKQGYGPELVEFVGSYDLVINPLLYEGYKVADKLRWVLLKLKK